MQAAMLSRIILLTGEVEAPILSGLLRDQNPALQVIAATSAESLAAAAKTIDAGTRLLSFCSPVIVPGPLLASLPGPSYNFHPGPPERPGRYPSVFALYEDADKFGVTVHEMLARVDSGPIVAAEWFDVPKDCDLHVLEEMTLRHLVTAFYKLSPHLATKMEPLPRQNIAWSGRKTTKADCDALAMISPDLDDAEAARRRRACGVHIQRVSP